MEEEDALEAVTLEITFGSPLVPSFDNLLSLDWVTGDSEAAALVDR